MTQNRSKLKWIKMIELNWIESNKVKEISI